MSDIEDKQRVLHAMELITFQTCVRFLAKNESHLEHIMFFKVFNLMSLLLSAYISFTYLVRGMWIEHWLSASSNGSIGRHVFTILLANAWSYSA